MERFRSSSHRVFSVRGIFTFVLVVIITTLFSVLIGGQATHAADPTDASWSGESIVHDGHAYSLVKDFKDTTNTVPSDATVYQSPPWTETNGDKKVFILYFTSGVDPPTAKSAKYVEFKYSATNGLSDPKDKKEVTLTVKGEEAELSSCSVSGIGWIICPVSVFLAEAMDVVFNILSGMIAVQPSVLGDTNNSMYIAWNVMRNIANIAFVIAFLIIIYSQLTNFGVSNYGLKKLIPRLIIAAILVNVSFIISAVAIDISNVLGYSIQNVFNGIRENVFNLTNDNFDAVNESIDNPWARLTALILAGGGVYAGVTYVAAGGLYMLIPLLLGLVLTLIFVVIVLAARQAIIIILVIIAPLAFVANLLPNTEKWFEKWKDLFFTMLIFFPAFSLVFGGSQLAGQLIVQNAGGNIITVLFGMAVQIAPLVITPLLLKFSGSLLGRIAQIANNPSKGILDRNKNWAGDRAEHAKQQNIAKGARLRNPASWGAGLVKNADFRKRRLKDRTDLFKGGADNLYSDSDGYKKIHNEMAGVELDKSEIQNRNAAHIERLKTTPTSNLYDRAIRTQASKENLDAATNRTNEHFNQRRVVSGVLNTSSNNLEASKARLETSENAKSVYLNQQRMMAGTVLNATVAPLETSKLRMESTQNQYTNMVENMKTNPGSSLYHIAQGVQSSKEILESSQNNTQTLFDRQRRTVGTGLNMSTIQLEEAKAAAEESKSSTAAYISEVKTNPGTTLHRNVVRAEEAKTTAQEHESNLATMINDIKADDTTVLHRRTIRAEDAKLATQISETNLGNVINTKKADATSDIYQTVIQSEAAKMDAQKAETNLANVIGKEKSTLNTQLNSSMMGAEQAKQRTQISDAQIAKTVDNFKTNKITEPLTTNLTTIMDEMTADAVVLAAESQASNSAKYEVQRNIAEVMTKGDPLSEKMLGIAQGVGGETAKFRAQAQFVKAATSLDNDALSSNVELLKEKAKRKGTNIKRYSNEVLEAVLDGQVMYESEIITPEMTKAAVQAQGELKNVPLFERMKGSTRIDQAMLREVVALNGPALMGAGAYGLVDDPTLSIDNFTSKEAFDHALSVQRISNLANANSTGLSGLKFGWVANSLAKPENLKNNIEAVLQEVQNGNRPNATNEQKEAATAAEASLQAAFKTVRGALTNEDTLATMRDREPFLRTIEAELAKVFGQEPLPSEDLSLKFDANSYANEDLPDESVVAPGTIDDVDDTNDTTTPPTPEQ